MTEMRIHGIMVTKNEADRYLEPCLEWASQFLDTIFIYDDRSTDSTRLIAEAYGAVLYQREEELPSFLEHEGQFRYNAWLKFQELVDPHILDWCFSFDADEFMVSKDHKDIRLSLETAIKSAELQNKVSVLLDFPEIFKIENGDLFYRTDGLWGTIKGTRLFKYKPGGTFTNKAMGCGSEPTYVSYGTISVDNQGLNVLHLGYAKEEDQQIKYNRYSSLMDHGHNDKHIQSILTPSTLKKWEGSVPDLGDKFE